MSTLGSPKRPGSGAAWTQDRLELGSFPVPSPGEQAGTRCPGSSLEKQQRHAHLQSLGLTTKEAWRNGTVGRGKAPTPVCRHWPAASCEDLWTEEMIPMFGSDPKKTLCVRGEPKWKPRTASSSLEHPCRQMPTGGFRRLRRWECAVTVATGPVASEAPSQQPSVVPPPPAAGSC